MTERNYDPAACGGMPGVWREPILPAPPPPVYDTSASQQSSEVRDGSTPHTRALKCAGLQAAGVPVSG